MRRRVGLREADQSMTPRPHAFTCPICFDELPWLESTRLCTSSRAAGGHRLCAPCATRYVDLAIGEGKLYVRCSGIGCGELLSPESLRKLASPGALATYEVNLIGVHTQRLADESDPTFLAFASEHARRCPACHVLIWRSAGCDHMACRSRAQTEKPLSPWVWVLRESAR